jgi:hypothetical protein
MPAPPLFRTFDRFEDAERARDALLAAGLPRSAVQLQVMQDEAGPVEGNFLTGNARTRDGDIRPLGSSMAGELPYDENFRETVSRGVHLLVVAPADEAERRAAVAILDAFECVDVEARVPPRP